MIRITFDFETKDHEPHLPQLPGGLWLGLENIVRAVIRHTRHRLVNTVAVTVNEKGEENNNSRFRRREGLYYSIFDDYE